MAVAFYMDVHVPQPITDQLRSRGVDVLTAIEEGREEAPNELLERARELGRVLFTQDIRFRVLAETWQHQNRPFAGWSTAISSEGPSGSTSTISF